MFALALLEGPFGKLIMSAISMLVFAGVLTGVYFGWKHNVQQEALIKFNQEQAAQARKDNDKFLAQQKDMKIKLDTITAALNKKNQALQFKSDNVKRYLSSPEAAKGDRPASPLIQETLRRLQ